MKNKAKFLLLSFFVFILFIIGGCETPEPVYNNPPTDLEGLTVSFIDIGQGDATLIECGGEAMLIDSGIYAEKEDLTGYIANRGVKDLKYCVATHPHSDHIGAMDIIINRFDVETLVYPLCDSDSKTMNYVLDACDENGVSYFNPQPMETFTLGEATFTVLSPEPYADYGNLNNNSMVLKMEYGTTSWLFMGDAEKEVEYELIEKSLDLSADVLKCGHHGSSTSSDVAFISEVNPAVAVISCGKNNDYGHPHRETLITFNYFDTKIFRTDELSTIVAETDGKTIKFSAGNKVLTVITANEKPKVELIYTGNKNSKVFHLDSCDSVAKMSEKNKVHFNNREDAVNRGYNPCKACNP